MNIPENILSALTDEQKKKIEAANSPEELRALAKNLGTELSLDQLEGVSGGSIPCLRHGQTPPTQGVV
ncbi:MAG: hypothetical protein ABTB30_17850 [Clostridia bacterium]